MTDPGVEDTLFPSDRTALGRELNQEAKEGFRALFHWAVFPFPLAVIPLGWGSQLPVFGFVFGSAALAVLAVWAIRAYGAWGDRAWPFVAQVWEALFAAALKGLEGVSRRTQSESAATPPAVEDARIEGTTAVRAALMDTVEADIQVAGQLAAFRTQIERLTRLNAESTTLTEEQRRTNELVIRQLRRNIADVEKAEAERTGVSLETHGPRPLFDALLPAEAAPAPRRAFLGAIPGFSFPFSWALAAVLAVTNLGTFWLWNGAREEARENAEFREGNRQVAEQWRENAEGWRDHARKVEADGTVTAGVLAEREAIIARARVNERRNRHAVEQVARDVPPVWFGGVQPPGDGEVGRGSADGGSGAGAGDPG